MSSRQPSLESGPVIELILASALWGFGFVAAIWALRAVGPFTVTTVRFYGAFIVGVPALIWACRDRSRWRVDFGRSAIPGLLLALTLIFQTWGLCYTTATKSGFITCLYVVMVPFAEKYFLKRQLRPLHYLFTALALFGTALIVGLRLQSFNFGDFLTLISAFMATLQILWLGVVSPKVKSPFLFNTWQCFFGGLLTLPLAWKFDSPVHFPLPVKVWVGLLVLTVGSTILAFFLQVRAQKKLSPSVASMLFLLESPFAALFGVLILHESLAWSQAAGAALIFIASLGSVW